MMSKWNELVMVLAKAAKEQGVKPKYLWITMSEISTECDPAPEVEVDNQDRWVDMLRNDVRFHLERM